MSIEDKLYSSNKESYGSSYDAHYIEQYKLYVEMADRISNRRQQANSFFLSVNTVVIAIVGYVQLGATAGKSQDFYWLISIAGIAICYEWYRLILSYKNLNSGKFKVVHFIEQKLPLAPYDAEWEILGRGIKPKLYKPFTKVEMTIPWIFLLLHTSVLLQVIPWTNIIMGIKNFF